jgi:hypothetical protein
MKVVEDPHRPLQGGTFRGPQRVADPSPTVADRWIEAKSWKVIAPGGGTLLWAYPLREKVEFSVSLIRERGDPDAAAEVLNACQDIVGGPLAEHFPTLDSSSMVANWERIESDVLNRLAVAASANPVGPTR